MITTIKPEVLETNNSLILDIRSPQEFAVGHVPGAQNTPLLDDDERAKVGTCYKQEGKTRAVQLGLELFAPKTEAFLSKVQELTKDSHSSSIVLYCWRGGMRSRSVATLLSCNGLQVQLLEGGYKQYRSHARSVLEDLPEHNYLVVNGKTGVGKTGFIDDCHKKGYPVLNFEFYANHCGSIFGDLVFVKTPATQQNFENKLVDEFLKLELKNNQPILVELEHSIGPVALPKKLRKKLTHSPMVYLDRDIEDRIDLLVQMYSSEWQRKKPLFFEKVKVLAKYFSKIEFQCMHEALDADDLRVVASMLLKNRYDVAYQKSLERYRGQVVGSFNLTHEYSQAMDFIHRRLGLEGV